jgi:UDP-2,3-diacylglucosamine pyrophosphatase LpxH
MRALAIQDRILCRTVWISDVHLGSVHSKADELVEFLDRLDCDRLFLVGDIVDMIAMKRRVHWPESHTRVLRRLLRLSRRGVEVIYIPGNHDWAFRTIAGNQLGKIRIEKAHCHVTATGKRILVTHGDELDYAVRYSRLNRLIGDIAYGGLMLMTRWVNRVRRWLRRPYWSLASWVKANTPQAERAVRAYQLAGVALAREQGFDGIVCGHLHVPCILQQDNILYCNDGDWVENCTALIETPEGDLQLMKAVLDARSVKNMMFCEVGNHAVAS